MEKEKEVVEKTTKKKEVVKNYFEILNDINVGEKIEKKNGLSYLSWAWAWNELKKIYPKANYKVYETENCVNYFNDGKTGWVKTGVIVEDIEHIEYLPIMDFRNKSIPVGNITSFDVNKAIQRSLTKAVARHGLGLYIYAGEDLPEEEVQSIKERNYSAELKKLCAEKNIDIKEIAQTYKLNTNTTNIRFKEVFEELNK